MDLRMPPLLQHQNGHRALFCFHQLKIKTEFTVLFSCSVRKDKARLEPSHPALQLSRRRKEKGGGIGLSQAESQPTRVGIPDSDRPAHEENNPASRRAGVTAETVTRFPVVQLQSVISQPFEVRFMIHVHRGKRIQRLKKGGNPSSDQCYIDSSF
eukprot:TRINITY_DN21885_c0_g2_i1.p1 TRINITY_DN21885_c0_g2~~TRINITY_DN21885_c0_g2_i1.p1  ORF type:complete len:155 (-),score=12.41 TRINITY_DN21885_c0_g2_i1:37-501(-)